MSQMILLSLLLVFTFTVQTFGQNINPLSQIINVGSIFGNLLQQQQQPTTIAPQPTISPQSVAQTFQSYACSIFRFLFPNNACGSGATPPPSTTTNNIVTTGVTTTATSSTTTVTTVSTTTSTTTTNSPGNSLQQLNIIQQVQNINCLFFSFLSLNIGCSTTSTPTTRTSSSTTTSTSTSTTTTTTSSTSTTTTTTTTTTTLKSYLSTCSRNEECDSSKNLYCYANSVCNSSTTSNAWCDCAPTFYWNTTQCVPKKSYRESCTSGINNECGYGLYCNSSFVCRCANTEYWNNSYCVSKLWLYFTSNNYTTKVINKYNNSLPLSAPNDVKVVEQPTYRIYVGDYILGIIAQYNQSGSYLRHTSVSFPFGIQPVNNNSIYVTSQDVNNPQTMYKLNSSLGIEYNSAPANSTYVGQQSYIRYNPTNGYLYECDSGTGYVNAFDLNYNRVKNESFMLNSGKPIGIGFYQSACLGNIMLVTTDNNSIQIVRQSDKTVYKTLTPVCPVNSPDNILVDQKSGYLLVSCFTDNLLQLWYTNGTDFKNTGKILDGDGPAGTYFDSYGRLMISNLVTGLISILTPFDYPF